MERRNSTLFGTLILIAICILFPISCSMDDTDDPSLTFIGDSEVEHWDVSYFFPEYRTVNKGISGAGLTIIEKMTDAALNSYAIVILGTNNIHSLTEEELPAYVDRYFTALKNLNGRRTFVYSIFPRSVSSDKPGTNTVIQLLNQLIQEKCGTNPTFTFLDVYATLKKDDGINPEYSYDGLHLNAEGYEVLAWKLKKELQ